MSDELLIRMMRLTVDVRFFLNGEPYGARRWAQIPRVGDEIMLGAGKAHKGDKHGKAAFRVIRVVWGTEAKDAPTDEQCCNIEVERL